jgi:hypothetical protein
MCATESPCRIMFSYSLSDPLRRSVRSMTTFFTEVRQTLVPRGEVKHGPLPPLLVAMTLVTGLVDAFSYLVLGHVFVANMTGNIVFLAFALAGASGFSIPASLVALGSFVLGSFGGGLLGSRLTFYHKFNRESKGAR